MKGITGILELRSSRENWLLGARVVPLRPGSTQDGFRSAMQSDKRTLCNPSRAYGGHFPCLNTRAIAQECRGGVRAWLSLQPTASTREAAPSPGARKPLPSLSGGCCAKCLPHGTCSVRGRDSSFSTMMKTEAPRSVGAGGVSISDGVQAPVLGAPVLIQLCAGGTCFTPGASQPP